MCRKNNILIITLLLVSAVLASCTNTKPVKGLPLPPKPIMQKYYSLLPPDEPGWYINYQDALRLELTNKDTAGKKHNTINASVIRLPRMFENKEFLEHVSISLAITPDAKRFSIIENKEDLFQAKQGTCVKYTSLTKDADAKSEGKFEYIRAYGLVCPHPHDHTVGIHLTYSNHTATSEENLPVKHKALLLLNSLEFLK